MAVAPIHFATPQISRDLDFSSLANLPNVYRQAQQQQGLAALGRGLADGSIDYRQAAGAAADLGNIDATMKFLALDEAQKKQGREQAASEQFLRAFNPGAPAAGAPTTARPAAARAPVEVSDIPIDGPSPLDPPSGQDRDAAIRTIIAESGNQGPTGMNAVGSVIRNRAVAGNYGGPTAGAVVASPNQFEPWNTAAGRAKMAGYDPNSPEYIAAARALDAAYAGNDPTNGALNFYAPKAQAALGRPAPAWDNGTGVDIGDHRFFGGAPQPAAAAPYQVAQAGPGAPASPSAAPAATAAPASGPSVPVLLQAIANPNLPAGQKDIAKMYLQKALKDMEPAERVKTLQALKDNPELLEIEKQLAAARKTEVNIDQRAEGAEAKKAGEAAGERRAQMFASAGSASKTLSNLSRVEALLDQVSQGKLEPTRMSISAWAKSFGLPDGAAEALGLDPKAVGSAQALQALTSEMVVGKIGAGGFPANNFSDADRAFLVGTMPQIANDPRGNKIIVQAGKRIAQLDIDRAKAWQEFRKDPANKGKGFEDFELEFSERMASKDVFGDLRKEAEAIVGPPRSAQQQAAPQADFEEPRTASDGNRYIRRGGRYFRVVD